MFMLVNNLMIDLVPDDGGFPWAQFGVLDDILVERIGNTVFWDHFGVAANTPVGMDGRAYDIPLSALIADGEIVKPIVIYRRFWR